jgi:hypothetical protein
MKDMSSKPKKGINKQIDETKWHIVLSEKETLLVSRTRQTCWRIIISLFGFLLSQ